MNGEGNNGEAGETTPATDANAQANQDVNTNQAADGTAGTEDAPPTSGDEHNTDAGKDEESLAHRYRTLQGMYNKEVPRLHSQNRELNSRVQHLEQLLASLSAQQSAPQASIPAEKLLTDKDVEEYGESLDVMRRAAMEQVSPMAQRINELENTIRQLQGNLVPQVQAVANRQAVSAEQQFWGGLTDAVPNWREINDNADFQTWLLEVDPLVGITRQTILEDAQRNLEVMRVSNFFKSWLEISGQANVAQNTRRSTSANELERQIAPGKGRSAGNPTGTTAKNYTREDINDFFRNVRDGKYRGREAERDRIERDIFAAQREGRIVVNA
jgi:TolA-binding protein